MNAPAFWSDSQRAVFHFNCFQILDASLKWIRVTWSWSHTIILSFHERCQARQFELVLIRSTKRLLWAWISWYWMKLTRSWECNSRKPGTGFLLTNFVIGRKQGRTPRSIWDRTLTNTFELNATATTYLLHKSFRLRTVLVMIASVSIFLKSLGFSLLEPHLYPTIHKSVLLLAYFQHDHLLLV